MIWKEINKSKQTALEQETKESYKNKIRKIKQARGEIQEFKLFIQERKIKEYGQRVVDWNWKTR